jgi:hypothetical protein
MTKETENVNLVKGMVNPSGNSTFAISKSYKWLILIQPIVFGGMLIGISFARISDPKFDSWIFLLGITFFGSLFYYSINCWTHINDYLQVNEIGITYVSKKGSSTFLPWGSISKLRGRIVLQRLDLYDTNGHRAMSLEYQLENFNQLRNIVHERTRNLREKHSEEKVFDRSTFFYGMFSSLVLQSGYVAWLFLVSSHSFGHIFGAILFTIFAIFYALVMFCDTRKVRIEPLTVVFVNWYREKAVPFTDICDITLETRSVGRGQKMTMVIIELLNGKNIRLSWFKKGEDVLFDSLKSAWSIRMGIRQ